MALILGSCAKDGIDTDLFPQEQGKEIVFRTSILQSRTTTNDRKTEFTEGDGIGIFICNRSDNEDIKGTNLRHQYQGNAWTAEEAAIFPIDGTPVNFYAYYPYAESNKTTTFDFSVNADQATDGINGSDLLLAKNETADANNTEVNLAFTHALALLEMKATLPDGVTAQKATLKAKATASVDLTKQTATLKADAEASEIVMAKTEDGTFRAVIPAQKLEGKYLCIEGDNGAPYWYTAKEALTLETNKVSTLTVTMQ